MTDDPRSEQAIRERVEKYYKDRGEFAVHFAFFAVINLVLWGIALVGVISWLVPFMLTLTWGTGVLANATEVYAVSNRWQTAILDATEAEMRQRYGPDWDVIANEVEYLSAYEMVKKRFENRKDLGMHTMFYVLMNVLLLVIVLAATNGQSLEALLIPLLLAVFWGLGLGAHYFSMALESGKWAQARERAIQDAIAREQARAVPKRKHDRLELAEDGELIDFIVEDDWQDDKSKREAK